MGLEIVDSQNKKVSELALSDETLKGRVNKGVLYYALKASRNALRHGDAKVKERSFVNKTNKKPYRQKGTGNARHASANANIFVGGGSQFGPQPRSYVENTNKKMRTVAYREAFKYYIQQNKLHVVKDLSIDKPSTKAAAQILKNLGCAKTLVVLPGKDTAAELSFRNLRNVKVIHENNLSIYEILRAEDIVLSAAFFEEVKKRYGL